MKKTPYQTLINERHFLNLPGFHAGAYVQAYIEDTSERGVEDNGGYGSPYNPQPRMILQIADCSNVASLEFDLGSPTQRQNSFHKIDTLLQALTEFRRGLEIEVRHYRRRQVMVDEAKRRKEQGEQAIAGAVGTPRRPIRPSSR